MSKKQNKTCIIGYFCSLFRIFVAEYGIIVKKMYGDGSHAADNSLAVGIRLCAADK